MFEVKLRYWGGEVLFICFRRRFDVYKVSAGKVIKLYSYRNVDTRLKA